MPAHCPARCECVSVSMLVAVSVSVSVSASVSVAALMVEHTHHLCVRVSLAIADKQQPFIGMQLSPCCRVAKLPSCCSQRIFRLIVVYASSRYINQRKPKPAAHLVSSFVLQLMKFDRFINCVYFALQTPTPSASIQAFMTFIRVLIIF